MGSAASSRFTLGCAAPLVAALLGWSAPAVALDPARAVTQYVHRWWTPRQGLPSNDVTAIAQDREGYLWIGTAAGVVRFDGSEFRPLPLGPELGKSVRALLVDVEGILWIGTRKGLARRSADGTVTRVPDVARISALVKRRRGGIWIAHHGQGLSPGGVIALDGGKPVDRRSVDSGLSHQSVLDVLEDRSGRLWIATGGGLDILEEGRLSSERLFRGKTITDLHEDPRGAIWANVYGQGLYRRDSTGWSHHPMSSTILDLEGDRDGNLWVATAGAGLLRWRQGRVESLSGRLGGQRLSNVLALLEDRDGTLWAGTAQGLLQLVTGRLLPFGAPEGLPDGEVTVLHRDRRGVLWAGSGTGGLSRFEGARFRQVAAAQGSVFALHDSRTGALWVGGSEGGIHQLQNGRLARTGAGAPYYRASALVEDRAGALWIGTIGRHLLRLEHGEATTIGPEHGLPSPIIYALLESQRGPLWVGTPMGLYQVTNGRARLLGSAEHVVVALHEDRDGTLWVGTLGFGLHRLRNGRWSAIGPQQGLCDDSVAGMVADEQDNLWMCSTNGIFVAARRQLEEVADGRTSRMSCRLFGVEEGMRSAECTGGGARTDDGRLWFATKDGVVAVDPARLLARQVPAPPVMIQRALVDAEEISLRAPVTAGPGDGSVEIHYAGLSYVAPEQVKYRYRLEGLNDRWIEADARRAAYFTNLAPGRYRFRVQARAGDSAWSEPGASLELTLRPRFRQTRTFLVLCGLGVLGLGMGAWHLRTRQLRGQAERALIDRELELAREVQQGILPGADVQTRQGVIFSGECRPATQCGGDWWGAFDLPDDRTLFVIGDVTGHGVASALHTMTARSCVATAVELGGPPPSELLALLNRMLLAPGMRGLQMSCLAALWDPGRRVLQCANAAHCFPFVARPDDGVLRVGSLTPRGLRIGEEVTVEYEMEETELPPGSVIVFFTDGLTEGRSPAGKPFGERRLRKLIQEHGADPPECLRDRILDAATAHFGPRPRADDVTLLVVRV